MKVSEETLNKAIVVTVAGIILCMSGMLFYFLSLRLGNVAKENQTYNRYISCVLSVPPVGRDQGKIDQCWTQVQKDTGIQVKRYDKEVE